MKQISACLALAAALVLTPAAHAGWFDDMLKAMGGGKKTDTATTPAAALSAEQITKGLREALAKGVSSAVGDLGRSDGFWAQTEYRVPLPESLQKASSALQKVGAGAAVDNFHLALNRAAEQAVPVAAEVLSDSVRKMSIKDAEGILRGPADSATRYFETSSRTALAQKFRPLVERVTAENGLANSYKAVIQSAGPFAAMLGDATDLDAYVTKQALDGLFRRIAVEEQKIRENPAARTTELLERVFGSL